MPFGISESAIAKAYGPLDLSGFYKGLDAATKKYDAESKFQKQALQKEYYTNVATLNKDITGTRPEDTANINNHYSNFKNAQQKLIANPRLIETNPEEYGRLTALSNEAFGSAMQLANASKAKAKQHKEVLDYMMKNPKKFKSDAIAQYSLLTKRPTIELDENNLDDVSKFTYDGPDYSDVNKNLNSFAKSSKTDVNIKKGEDAAFGATFYDTAEITNPLDYGKKISNYIMLQPDSAKFADSLMEKFSPQVDNIASKWDSLDDNFFEQFKTTDGKDMFPLHQTKNGQSRKPDLTFDSGNSANDAISFLTAQNVLSDIPKIKKTGQTEFKEGEIGKKKMLQTYALEGAKILEDLKQTNRIQLVDKRFINAKDLMSQDRRLEGIFKVVSSLIGKEAAFDISLGGTVDVDEIIQKLYNSSGKVSNQVTPKETKPTGKKPKPY